MTSNIPGESFGLMLERRHRYGNDHITAKLMRNRNGELHPLNCIDDAALDGLQLDGYVSTYDVVRFVGFDVPEYATNSVDMRRAEIMVKHLRRIRSRIVSMGARTPGEILVALAWAMKLAWVCRSKIEPVTGNYADYQWTWMTLGEGKTCLQHMIDEALQDACPKLQTA